MNITMKMIEEPAIFATILLSINFAKMPDKKGEIKKTRNIAKTQFIKEKISRTKPLKKARTRIPKVENIKIKSNIFKVVDIIC